MTKEKTRNGQKWTEARYESFITSALRAAWRRWPPKWITLKEAFAGVKKNKKTGRQAKHYTCAICNKGFPQTEVQIDHISPIGTCDTWDEFIEKLYCEAENLQVICKADHKIKTRKEKLK